MLVSGTAAQCVLADVAKQFAQMLQKRGTLPTFNPIKDIKSVPLDLHELSSFVCMLAHVLQT